MRIGIIKTSLILFACCIGLSATAQRINADGRKMVKTVKRYELSGPKGFHLSNTYEMEYNDKNELVKFTEYNKNGKVAETITRKGNSLNLNYDGIIELDCELNKDSHVVRYEKNHIPRKNVKGANYGTGELEYDEKGRLVNVTERTFDNIDGKHYKECLGDREYISFKYDNGFVYRGHGALHKDNTKYMIDEKIAFTCDSLIRNDINFSILTCEYHSRAWHHPLFFTEWCPTYNEYMPNGDGGLIYYYDFDRDGNIVSIDMKWHRNGKTMSRYEIEYVY